MMKRLLTVVLAVVLCLALTSCSALKMVDIIQKGGSDKVKESGGSDPLVGTWICSKASASGMEVAASVLFAEAPTLDVQAKGRLTLVYEGEEYKGRWSSEGNQFTLTSGGEDFIATVTGGVMEFKDLMGVGLTFEKEGGIAVDAPKPTTAPTQDASGKDFAGFWVGKTASILGEPHSDMIYGMMKVSDSIFMELNADGSGRIYYMGDEVPTKWTQKDASSGTIQFMTIDCKAVLENGELSFNLSDVSLGASATMEYTFVRDSGTYDAKVSSVADGSFGDDEEEEYDFGYDANDVNQYSYPENIPDYEGDWFGVVYIGTATGEFAYFEDYIAEAVARFSFIDGECEAFIGTYLDTNDENFRILGTEMGSTALYLDCTFLGVELEEIALTAKPGQNLPWMGVIEGGDSRDGFRGVISLRRWGEPWASTDEYSPESASVDVLESITFEQAAEFLELDDLDSIPPVTDVTAMVVDQLGVTVNRYGYSASSSGASSGSAMPDTPTSSVRLDTATLGEIFESYRYGTTEFRENNFSFEQLLEKTGCDPSEYEDFSTDPGCRVFIWIAKESKDTKMRFVYDWIDGQWVLNSASSVNLP